MNNTFNLNKVVRIDCKSHQERLRIGTEIHKQLVGNPDYINNNIVLNIDTASIDDMYPVLLYVDASVVSMPAITLQLVEE